MADDIFDVVDENDCVIGRMPRKQVHREGHKHRAVHVLIFNSRGEIFLQKRSMSKDNHPGVWDSSCSGHVDSGEEYDATTLREVREELGITLPAVPKRLFRIAACKDTGEEFVWIYRAEAEGPFHLNPEEIDDGGWFTPEKVDQWVAQNPGDFAPAFKMVWGLYRNSANDKA